IFLKFWYPFHDFDYAFKHCYSTIVNKFYQNIKDQKKSFRIKKNINSTKEISGITSYYKLLLPSEIILKIVLDNHFKLSEIKNLRLVSKKFASSIMELIYKNVELTSNNFFLTKDFFHITQHGNFIYNFSLKLTKKKEIETFFENFFSSFNNLETSNFIFPNLRSIDINENIVHHFQIFPDVKENFFLALFGLKNLRSLRLNAKGVVQILENNSEEEEEVEEHQINENVNFIQAATQIENLEFNGINVNSDWISRNSINNHYNKKKTYFDVKDIGKIKIFKVKNGVFNLNFKIVETISKNLVSLNFENSLIETKLLSLIFKTLYLNKLKTNFDTGKVEFFKHLKIFNLKKIKNLNQSLKLTKKQLTVVDLNLNRPNMISIREKKNELNEKNKNKSREEEEEECLLCEKKKNLVNSIQNKEEGLISFNFQESNLKEEQFIIFLDLFYDNISCLNLRENFNLTQISIRYCFDVCYNLNHLNITDCCGAVTSPLFASYSTPVFPPAIAFSANFIGNKALEKANVRLIQTMEE
ncbi:hypothetical protein HK099_000834, partial [Clydaea vesicula]